MMLTVGGSFRFRFDFWVELDRMQAGFRFVSALIRPCIDHLPFPFMYRQLYFVN